MILHISSYQWEAMIFILQYHYIAHLNIYKDLHLTNNLLSMHQRLIISTKQNACLWCVGAGDSQTGKRGAYLVRAEEAGCLLPQQLTELNNKGIISGEI